MADIGPMRPFHRARKGGRRRYADALRSPVPGLWYHLPSQAAERVNGRRGKVDVEVKGCCPLDCQDACSWAAHVEDGVVTKVVGDKDHPFTRGVLCAKVYDYQARTYSPDRLLHPMRRSGARGSGAFERITWDAAIDEIARRFRQIIRADGAEALMPLHDMGSAGVMQRRALMRLFQALGASRLHGSLCGQAGNAMAAEGHLIGLEPETIIESECILLWGANLLSTAHHHWHFRAEARKRRGARNWASRRSFRTTRRSPGRACPMISTGTG